jgi:hypothetical protein
MTITESPNISVASGHVSFSRKVSVRQYESADASISISFDIPTDPDMSETARGDQIIANARAAFFQAKAIVYEELAISFSVDDNGIVHEVLERHFGNVTEVAAESPAAFAAPAAVTAFAAPAPSGGADQPPFSAETTDKDERRSNSNWAKARYNEFPNEYFDNRPKKADGSYKSNAPDFKHKDTKIGFWL